MDSFKPHLLFFKALYRRWKALGLDGTPDIVLRMASALALLPANDFLRGAEEIARFVLEDPTRPHLQQTIEFTNYIINSWAPIAAVVSVNGCPTRTNNYAEAFYRHALRRLGGAHPNIFEFLGNGFCL